MALPLHLLMALFGSRSIASAFTIQLGSSVVREALIPPSIHSAATARADTTQWARRATTLMEDDVTAGGRFFDPLGEATDGAWDVVHERRMDRFDASTAEMRRSGGGGGSSSGSRASGVIAVLAALPLLTTALPNDAVAKALTLPTGDFNPENFKPVCSASDSFYRFLQGSTEAVVGKEAFVEYGPLIAGGLLRIRLELCVVESFFNEAVGPFIKANGLSWILPLHETVETFLAGTIFALATTFILVGSTKIVAVITVYGDAFIGAPCRLFGGFFFDRALGKPVTLDVGFGPIKTRVVGPPEEEIKEVKGLSDISVKEMPVVLASGAVKYLGEASKIIRETIESLDVFIGRYLVLIATGYIGLKFVHFKLFPDFPPF